VPSGPSERDHGRDRDVVPEDQWAPRRCPHPGHPE
jgi:hypothetical protein